MIVFLIQKMKIVYLGIPVAWSFRRGSTIAKNRSAESAVRVNTETPIDMSLAHSDTLQSNRPKGQDSRV